MSAAKKRWSAAGLILLGVVAGLIFASQLRITPEGFAYKSESRGTDAITGDTSSAPVEVIRLQDTGKAFTAVSREVLPTVVSISSTIQGTSRSPQDNTWDLRDFFRFYSPQEQESRPQRGMGSGVIVSDDGYILTNHHVIDGADEIKVVLYDNRSFEAKLVGTDPLTEIALIKIEGKDLPAIRFGDSDEMEVGEWVLAIGNPLNLSSTVTAGIVSAKGRGIGIIQDRESNFENGSLAIENFIQTDAAINPGNSGGALVNLKAELIGINTAIATGTGYYTGAGFAIPINLARKIMNDFIKYGHVNRPWLGISMRNVDDVMAIRFKMDVPRGVYIDKVLENTPAEKAGLKFLDVILAVDGEDVNKSNRIQSIIAQKNPGDKITLTILRDGREMEVVVKLGRREADTAQNDSQREEEFHDLGLTVLNPEDVNPRMGTNIRGVYVSGVERFSPAYDAGIVQGSWITRIEDQDINSVADYRRELSKYKNGDVVIFHIVFRNQEARIPIKIQ
ncbi:Do family serine endopeptidase [bacterium]|nr:Do family serine endopeptidase [bacterium]